MSASAAAWTGRAARRPRTLRPAWLRRLGMVAAAMGFGLLLFGRWNAERLARGGREPALEHLVMDLAGVYGALVLLPAVAWMARRAPLSRGAGARWPLHLPLHAAALVAFSAAHTTLVGLTRTWLLPLLGLTADQADQADQADPKWALLRYGLELPNDGILELTVRRAPKGICIELCDDGPGLAPGAPSNAGFGLAGAASSPRARRRPP
ncbi:hypothetical protein [Pendulispora albinea]|uniref:Uncharacterized protein n=1 Tax=Pendulispora albinea TaxID=2741071 RepID=A0ABZ2M7K9_9BACT